MRKYTLVAIGVGILVWLFWAAQPIDFRAHAALLARLRGLRSLEVELAGALHASGTARPDPADSIVARVDALGRLLEDALDSDGWRRVRQDADALETVAEYRAALAAGRAHAQELREASDRRDIDAQALRSALERIVQSTPEGPLRERVTDLARCAGAIAIAPHAKARETIVSAIAAAVETCEEGRPTREESITSAFESARRLVATEQRIAESAGRIDGLHLRRCSTAIVEACEKWALVEAGGNEVFRICLYGYALLLLLLFAHELRSREALLAHVARIQESLETRVRRRTAQLSRKNEHLANEIRERKDAEDQLVAARKLAESASRTKSEFLANMSHEIRTPMTSILGYAERLGDEELGDGERHDAVETIQRNGQYLLQLINDILDLSKIEAGKLVVEQIACSPAQVVLDVQSAVEVRAQAKGLEFAVELPARMPERIVTDPTRLKQVLINLVGNAIKFTERGSVTLRVRCDGAQDPRATAYLCFDVIDTGIGMDEAQIQRLFRPFTQADSSTTRRFGGTGLGLSICKTLVECMGGSLEVASQPGAGSRFAFRVQTGPLDGVPWIDDEDIDRMRLGIEAERLRESGVLLHGRVLLAEDGEDNQRLLTHFLLKAGAEVEVAVDGHKAVERALAAHASGRPFDVIVMDMQMPRLDGYGATARLRAAGYRRPIIALTANAMAHDRKRCLDAGCDDFCSKPIDKYRFLSIVARWTVHTAAGDVRSPLDAAGLAFSKIRTLAEVSSTPVEPYPALPGGRDVHDAPITTASRVQRSRHDAGAPPSSCAAVAPESRSTGTCAISASDSKTRIDAADPELAELVRMFVADLSRDVDRLTEAMERGDTERVAFIAHQLKGSSGSYGFPELSKQAARLERCAKGELGESHVEIELEEFARLTRVLQGRSG